VIILGREQPSPRGAERLAKAIWYDTKRPIRCIEAGSKGEAQYPYEERRYTMCDGNWRSVSADSGGSRPRIRDDVAHHSDLISPGVPR